MSNPYKLDLTAAQINVALNNAHDSGNAPTSGSGKLVNSNKIYEFVTDLVGDETDAREAADNDLDGRVSVLESVPAYGTYSEAFVYAASPQSDWRSSTGVLDFIRADRGDTNGYTVLDSSLSVPVSNGVLTISPGTWFVEYSFRVNYSSSTGNPAQVSSIRVNDVAVRTQSNSVNAFTTYSFFLGGFFVTKDSDWTLDIYWEEGEMAVASVSSVTDPARPIFKLRKMS